VTAAKLELSLEDVHEGLRRLKYFTTPRVETAIWLAVTLEKPLLAEGPAGAGKTEIAKVLAELLETELVRLQCYEGLDEARALYEWNYQKQLLRIQSDQAERRAWRDVEEHIFSREYLLERPLLHAIAARRRVVLLIDEIDKADEEFEAFLLEVLSDFQVSVPEIGTIVARNIPLVVLTSNNTREVSDALKRRCLHLFIDFPSAPHELEIIKLKVPEVRDALAADVVAVVQAVRKLDLKKSPSISETLDWARALALLNVETLGEDAVNDTLSTIFKYEGDIRKAQGELREYVARQKAKMKPEGSPSPSAASDKDALH